MFKLPVAPAAYPVNVKLAFAFLLLAWCCHFVFLLRIFQGAVPSAILWQQVLILAILVFLLVQLKNWARMLCIMCNILLILVYFMFAVVFMSDGKSSFGSMSLVVIVTLGLSIFYWLKPEVAGFYKLHTGKQGGK